MPVFKIGRAHLGRARLVTTLCLALAAAAAPTAHAATLAWEPTPSLYWDVNAAAILASLHDGQCTDWAATVRPDVVMLGVETAITSELSSGLPEQMPTDWRARNWPGYAAAAGIPTGRKPVPGALMVMQPGTLGAGQDGHIAVVQRIGRKGTFVISQMNAPYRGRVTYRKLRRSAARLPGVTFIYHAALAQIASATTVNPAP
jgi:hypothetical protein